MSNEIDKEKNTSTSAAESRPHLDKKDLLLSLVVVLLCGCVLSGAIPSEWIWLASLAMFAYVVIAIRNIGAVIQLLLASVIATVLTFLPVCGAAVLALVLGAGTLAWLFMILPKFKWAPIGLLAVAYGLGFLVTSNLITPLLSLAFLPAAALMAWAHARDIGRTNTVLHALLGFLIATLATLCVLLWRTYGALNYDVLMRFVNELKDLFVTIGLEAGKILWETVETTSTQTTIPAETLQKLKEAYELAFAEGNLRVLADSIMGLAPAIITVPAMILSYLANIVLLRKYYNTAWRSHMTPAACSLVIGPAAALIYFVCLIVVLFATKESMALMAVRNMLLILLPGLCLTGVNIILQNARRARGWVGVVSILLLVATICCMGVSSVYFIAMWGAYVILSAVLHQKMLKKMKDHDDKNEQ